jgi:hypothetical protein
LDRKPIITLPEKHVHEIEVNFNNVEREFYDALERRIALRVNAFMKEGLVLIF